MLQTGTVKESTFRLLKRLQTEPLLAAVQKRIVKMTDYPDKVYSTAPLRRKM